MMSTRIALAAGSLMLGIGAATVIRGQRPAFDVASVKPNKARVRQSMTTNPGGIAYTSVSLIDGLQAAYGVKRYQIAGPDWLGSERYDINATTGGAASNDQIKAMLQTLIADRFAVAAPREELPVFAILVGKRPGSRSAIRPAEAWVPHRAASFTAPPWRTSPTSCRGCRPSAAPCRQDRV